MDQLKRKIHQLPKRHLKTLSDDELNKIQAELKELYRNYNPAIVLATLYKHWSLEEAVDYFNRVKKTTVSRENIKTLAVYYTKINNGGIERVMASLINLWVKMGYKVILITTQKPSPFDFKYDSSVKRYIIPLRNQLKKRLETLAKICLDEHVDMYVNNFWLSGFSLWEIALLNELNIPYVTHAHGVFDAFIFMFPNRYLHPDICCLSDAIVSLSENNYLFYKDLGGNAFQVNNPVPIDLMNKPRCDLNSNHILFIGRIDIYKRPFDALKIFKIVHKNMPDATLDIVGGQIAILSGLMKIYIKLNGLSHHVKLHGQVDNQTAQKFYAQSSCMLFTSGAEGYPMTLLEAKSFGLPIAMYDLDYLTLVKGYKGITAAPIKSIKQLANNLISILKDSNYRQKLSDESYNDFVKFSQYDLAAKWQEIINGVKTGFAYNKTTTTTRFFLNDVKRFCKNSIKFKFYRFLCKIFYGGY